MAIIYVYQGIHADAMEKLWQVDGGRVLASAHMGLSLTAETSALSTKELAPISSCSMV